MRRPDIEAALWWFEQTHELVSTGFGATWRKAWLPHPGSVGEQDAWLWDAMQVVQAERMRELVTERKSADLAGWRERTVKRLRG